MSRLTTAQKRRKKRRRQSERKKRWCAKRGISVLCGAFEEWKRLRETEEQIFGGGRGAGKTRLFREMMRQSSIPKHMMEGPVRTGANGAVEIIPDEERGECGDE